jgi:hypothetical protein
LSWAEAHKACCAMGMTLMYLDNSEKSLFLMKQILEEVKMKPSLLLISNILIETCNFFNLESGEMKISVWTAGYRQTDEFKWCPSGGAITQKITNADKDKNCLIAHVDMVTKDAENSKLEAVKCTDENNVICEVGQHFPYYHFTPTLKFLHFLF